MFKWVLGCLLLCGLASSVTYADTIGPDCGSCGGVVYTLTYAPASAPSNGTQWYNFTLQVDTTGINVSTAKVLTAVALGVPAGATGATLVSAPLNGGWTMQPGGTNSGGCSGNGNFDCARATTASLGTGSAFGVPTGANDIYTFVFGFLLPAGSAGPNAWDLKAVYDTTAGRFGGLQTSETYTTPVPEPGGLALLGTGFLVIGALIKRR